MSLYRKISIKASRIMNYEYWPYQVFYFPMFLYGIYLGIKARSFTYYTTTNPSMKYGGIMGESKFRILQMIPEAFRPKSTLIERNAPFSEVILSMGKSDHSFPIIAKPDVGERGYRVEVISNKDELENYHSEIGEDYIIQEFIPYPLELGVLYYKIPGHSKGTVSSVVIKKFLELKGDSRSTVRQLIESEIRASGRYDYLKEKFSDKLDEILPKGDKILAEPIGNHCRGTTFLNGSHLINDKLVHVFDEISKSIPDFYYGRFDVKVSSQEDLYNGKNIKILELNGVSSEPAHIYDPGYSLWKAYGDVKNHMRVIYKISKINRSYGYKYAPLSEFMKDVRNHFKRSEIQKTYSV